MFLCEMSTFFHTYVRISTCENKTAHVKSTSSHLDFTFSHTIVSFHMQTKMLKQKIKACFLKEAIMSHKLDILTFF